MAKRTSKPLVVLLDRDGIINRMRPDYVKRSDEIELAELEGEILPMEFTPDGMQAWTWAERRGAPELARRPS